MTDHQVRVIRRIAEMPRTPFGEGVRLAESLEMGYRSFIVSVHRERRQRNSHRTWLAVSR